MKNIFLKNRNPESPSKDKNIDFILINEIPGHDYSELELKRSLDLVPKWYKNLSPYVSISGSEDLSLKKCIPFLDAINTGYFLVTKKDYTFSADHKKESYSFSSDGFENGQKQKTISSHPLEQVGDMPFSDNYIKYLFKWNNPYQIKTPKGYGVLFTHPLNYHDLPFYSLSGVVDTDTFPLPVLFPFIMQKNFDGVIPAGTPVIQIVPFKKENWKHNLYKNVPMKYVDNVKKSANEYLSKRLVGNKVVGGIYKKLYRNSKKYL